MRNKKGINKKILLGVISLFACICIIVMTSFFPFLVDPSKFMTKEFLTNELIIVAIVVFSTISVMFIGQASNSSNPNSEIAKARVKFEESAKKITNINSFFQWVRRVQQPEDIKQIKERELRKIGIEDVSILELEIKEIENLIGLPQRYNGIYYKSITKQQAKEIIYLKTKLKIDLVQPNYYLSYKTIDADRTITEQAGNEGKKKASIISISLISKLTMTIIIAMIFSSFIPDESGKMEIVKACSLFFSRMMAVVSSSFTGFMVGSQINDVDAKYIENRIIVHKKYLEDTTFKPLTQQEEAKEQFANRVKEENQILMLGGNNDERRREEKGTSILD